MQTGAFPNSPAERLRRFRPCLGQLGGELLIALVLFASFITYPANPGADLDSSWRQVLGAVADGRLQFGGDIAFTYGPLGYLLTPSSTGAFATAHWYWQVGHAIVFALIVLAFSRAYRGALRGLVIAIFAVILAPQVELIHLLMLMLGVFAYGRHGTSGHALWAVGLGLWLGVSSLEKFTHLIFAGALVPSLAVLAWLQGRRNHAWLLPVSFLATFVLGWRLCGQHLGDIPAYLAGAAEISSGYSLNMGLACPPALTVLALITATLTAGYALLHLWRNPGWMRAAAIVLPALLMAFLNWKHGFVRADAHTQVHFLYQLFLVLVLPVFLAGIAVPPLPARVLRLGAVVAGVLCLLGLWWSAPATFPLSLRQWNYRVLATKDRLTHQGRWDGELRDTINHARNAFLLPDVAQKIGGASVDVLGHENAYAIFNGFNYTPRPAFQGYFATTSGLMARNAAWFTGTHAPEFVLQKLQTIDDRLPALDDSLATLAVYQNYRLLGEFRRFLLWQRRTDAPPASPPQLIAETEASWGESVVVPDDADGPIWCEVALAPNLLGRLKTTLYKPESLRIQVNDSSGFSMTYRYLASTGAVGFLVAPHLVSNFDLLQAQRTVDAPQIKDFRLLPADGATTADYPDRFTVRFLRLPPFAKNPDITGTDRETLFRSFSQLPVRYEAFYQIAELPEYDQPVVSVHPPGLLEFRRPESATRLTGKFAFFLTALAEGNASDGVRFVIEWKGADGEHRTLFDRTLEPTRVPADRTVQSFDVALPPGPGLVRMITDPGPSFDLSYDWVYWQDISFTDGTEP